MGERRASVHILKLAAAQRQLDAAIRMTFAEEDTLAITTVAAAAYTVLRNIRERRGHKVLAEELRDSALGIARSLAKGEISESDMSLFRCSDMWPMLSKLAERIRALGTDRRLMDLRSLLQVNVGSNAERLHWRRINKAANFLKHADIDSSESLPVEELNADELILLACELHLDVTGHLTAEMEVWVIYKLYTEGTLSPPARWKKNAEALRAVKPDKRNRACSRLISNLKRQRSLSIRTHWRSTHVPHRH